MRRKLDIVSMIVGAALMVVLAGCSAIDENLDDCGEQAQMDYELELVTNVSTEVQTQLNAQTDVELAATLKDYLGGIFTDYAHDVNLSFYATVGDSTMLYHDEHIMNSSEHSYTLYIPRQKYMHQAVANIEGDPVVYLDGMEKCHKAALRQVAGDTIESHNTGIFTARQLMEMIEGIDQTFNVKLFMANCSAMLKVDPQGHDVSKMRVFTTGFATAFYIADSVYEYKPQAPMIRTTCLEADESGQIGLVSVNFPSREPSSSQSSVSGTTRTVIETTDPFIAQPSDEVLWEFHIFLPQADGTITKTVLGIKEPLRAGQFKIIKAKIGENGAVEPEAPTVGVSVTLDWKSGGTYNPDL